MTFHAQGEGQDLETYHPLAVSGKKADPLPGNATFSPASRSGCGCGMT